MTSVNPNFDYRYPYLQQQQTNSPAANKLYVETETSNVQLPEIYQYSDSDFENLSLKEKVKQYDPMGIVSPWFEHPILMLGSAGALSYGIDKFAQGCGGEYEKSLLYKATKFGDNIENSKIINSKPVQTIYGGLKSGSKKIAHLFKNSDVINSILHTPSLAEWSLPKGELLNQSQRVVHEFGNIVNTLKLTDIEKCASISEIGLDKAEKKWLKEFFNVDSLSKIAEQKRVNATLLRRLEIPTEEIKQILSLGEGATAATKDKLIKALGLSLDDLKKLQGEVSEETVKKVLAATKKVKGKIRIGAGEYSWLGPFQPFKRFIGCDGIHNKLYSMTLKEGAQTKTGKLMSILLQKCYHGFTFGGGKIGVLLFVAPHLVETMKNIKKADADQKVGTAINGIISSMSWVFTFPLALEIIHRIGGMQYAGMSKEQVAKYRELLHAFNDKVTNSANPEFFKDKGAYDAAKKQLKAELKALKPDPKKQTFITKICKKIGRFVTLDLERIKSYRNGNFIRNTVDRLPSIFRNGVGVPLRLIAWGVLSMFVLESAISKGIKKVFGNYYDSMKEEEHEANKKQQKQVLKDELQKALLEAQLLKTQQFNTTNPNEAPTMENNQAVVTNNNTTPVEPAEIKAASSEQSPVSINAEQPTRSDKTNNITHPSAQYIPNQNPGPEILKATENKKQNKIDNYTYIPSSENTIQAKSTDVKTNKYIPAQTAGNFTKTFDNSHLASALRRADRAEKQALDVLSGNFNNM